MMNCAPAPRGADDRGEQRERARDRERRLGLVEQVEAVAAEPVGGEREERLAVRLLVQRHVAVEREVRRELAAAVDEARDVEEALGPQEVAVARLASRERTGSSAPSSTGARHGGQLARAAQLAALGREAHRLGERLDERRLAGAVVARQQRDGRVEREIARARGRDRRHVEREPAAPGRLVAPQAGHVGPGAEPPRIPPPRHGANRSRRPRPGTPRARRGRRARGAGGV